MANGSVLIEERAVPRGGLLPSARSGGGWLSTILLSALTGLLLLGSLVFMAGPWAILANTRALNLLIGGGVVKYHDRHAGFIEGIPDYEYYIASQDPINWTILLLVIGAYLAIWSLKSLQFHILAHAYGIRGTFSRHGRAFVYGQIYRDVTPFDIGDAAAAASLRAEGAPLDRIRSVLFAFNAFLLFELAAFALLGLLGSGWAAWLAQIFWSLAIVGILYLWTRPPRAARRAAGPPTRREALRAHAAFLARQPLVLVGAIGLSLLAFGLRDVAAYLTAMAFSTQHVLLNIEPAVILMGVVGGYVATLIRLTPGGIGQFEWGFAAALFIAGVGLPEAATVALLVSALRYAALLVLFLTTIAWRGARTNFRAVAALAGSPEWRAATAQAEGASEVPPAPALYRPTAPVLWRRAVWVGWLALGVFLFDRLTLLLSDMWLFQSLGLAQIFSVNFAASATLFVAGGLAFAAAVAVPALIHPIGPALRRSLLAISGLAGLLAGYLLAGRYLEFLIFGGVPFGQTDPVFGNDVGFYVFSLPALWVVWHGTAWLFGVLLVASLACAAVVERRKADSAEGRSLADWTGALATPTTLVAIGGLGLTAAAGIWLSRYNLLFKDNYSSSVFVGAEYLDVVGLFSTLNQINLTALVALGVTAALLVLLSTNRRSLLRGESGWSRPARVAGIACLALIAADFAFTGAVAIRDATAVTPNQPVIQLEYIRRHIDATRAAFGLDRIEEVSYLPYGDDGPLPDIEQLLESPTIRNAPLWPSFSSYLERLVDPQHADRVLQTGTNMVYGPTLETFRQKQKLRTYYDFLDVDTLRFPIDGATKVFASAVRELPILEPQPWLAWWGQRFMLFTHGHGLVMAPVAEANVEGEPVFASREIPIQTTWPELDVANPQIYYGEGAASMAISNVRNMEELDFPTDQGRALNTLGPDSPAGVPVDSALKRLVFGWRSGEFFEMLFSSLVTPETRLHYSRQPLERLSRVAPFLYLDSNSYATIVDGQIVWMVNGLTTSDRYPYSNFEYIGDKSISRGRETIETKRINYVEDSVKATVDARTGQVRLYKISDSPVIAAWSRVYPGLFSDGAAMPAGVRQQLTYPLHLFHTQFDDLYIYYHMDDPTYFFNMEDMWDDADEVLGPMIDGGQAVTFSIEPQAMLLETGGALPEASQRSQFAMVAAYTPEGARNLRAVPIAYQDGDDYGRLVVLEVPKGRYVIGPEQADALIDQEPEISEQLSWWNRTGNQVIRGHTSLLPIGNELLYVEPLFTRSEQNPIPQLKRVVVVFRGKAYMDDTLPGALRLAVGSQSTVAEGPEQAPDN